MADTRCANPEYRYDVDNLMLEYVVYKAIESHLRLLRVLSATPGSRTNEGGRIYDLCSEAARLTETFDILLNLFKQNYGNKSLREPVFIDADVLRFMVLLILWLQRRINLDGPRLEISPDSMQRWQLDLKINRFFRNLWLKARGNESSVIDSIPEIDPANPAPCLADHLLPLFMYLSEKMQPTDTNLSEKWMKIAAEFMLQASIEILEAPNIFDDRVESARLALEECFAWGYVRRATFESEIDQLVKQANDTASDTPDRTSERYEHIREIALSEDQCWRMFYDEPTKLNGHTNAGSSTPQSSGEVGKWTKLRQETLDEVLTTFTTMQEEDGTTADRPVAWLKNRHQLNTFLEELGRFLAASWGLVHSIDWFGKPVLIQIEEGGLEGMNAEEFEAFKVRAGIDSSQFGFASSIV